MNVLGNTEKNPKLVLSDVCKNFGGVVAARDINLEIFGGEVVGLIGPNGAGKTTLINLILKVKILRHRQLTREQYRELEEHFSIRIFLIAVIFGQILLWAAIWRQEKSMGTRWI